MIMTNSHTKKRDPKQLYSNIKCVKIWSPHSKMHCLSKAFTLLLFLNTFLFRFYVCDFLCFLNTMHNYLELKKNPYIFFFNGTSTFVAIKMTTL